MKKRLLLFVLASCMLSGCGKGPGLTSQVHTTMPTDINQVSTVNPIAGVVSDDCTESTPGVSITQPSVSDEEEMIAMDTTFIPSEAEPDSIIELVTQDSEPPNMEQPTETISAGDDLDNQTLSTENIAEQTETTEEIVAGLDCEVAMNVGNHYGAATYGWITDPSLNEANAGFNFGSWVFAEEGQAALDAAGVGQIDFLYNSLKAAYPDMEISGIRFRVHAFAYGDGLYEVRVYYA